MTTQAFKIGDSVLVLDDDFSGEIISISKNTITILTEDGFELDFNTKELVKQEVDNTFAKHIFKNESFQDVVSEKEAKKQNN